MTELTFRKMRTWHIIAVCAMILRDLRRRSGKVGGSARDNYALRFSIYDIHTRKLNQKLSFQELLLLLCV
jgi:hypothetical protein